MTTFLRVLRLERALGMLLCLALVGCNRAAPSTGVVPLSPTAALNPASPASTPYNAPVASTIRFRETAAASGLGYRWKIEGKRPLTILQTIGNGCAFLDYDGDGNLDVLLVGPKLALYKGDGKGHFTDVTRETGLDKLSGHFLGCAVGDYDNDGYPDLYISGYHTGLLLHNEGGIRFTDVTKAMGLAPQPWGASCGFADLDGDGYLDLFVANYVKFEMDDLQTCPFQGVLTGCGPNDYDARHGVLYHNEGGKRFRDVTRAWKTATHGKGLGVAFADYDGSGHMGFAVANDLQAGDLFQNEQNGRLKNIAAEAGVALSDESRAHAGMGIDWGDYDNDGRLDLFVTTFSGETKCLYHNDGNSLFTITSEAVGLDAATLPYVAWGCKFFDADNDGWLDLIIANGHVQDNIQRFAKETYRQPTLFLHNKAGRPVRFEDGGKAAGLAQLPPIMGRGVAVGDFDNDGRMDALVVDSEGAPLLLHNESVTPNNWIGFCLIGTGASNRSAYGAQITVVAGGEKRLRQCHPGGSYLSSSDPRVHFGLGTAKLDKVMIRWPDGSRQTWTDLTPNRYYTVTQGQHPQ